MRLQLTAQGLRVQQVCDGVVQEVDGLLLAGLPLGSRDVLLDVLRDCCDALGMLEQPSADR